MKMTNSLGKRLLALVVTLALLLTFLPRVALTANATITTADMVQGSKKVDPYTIHNWKQYFGPNVMSTEYTGGVWSDKSVFNSFAEYQAAEGVQNFVSPAGNNITDPVKEMLATDPENFLVTMSAITANKSLSGSSSTPMDTMLVLDVSGSMQGSNAVAVVEATNRAIKTLLDQNVNNRVGVILYSGNNSQGNSQTSTASVLLPLGRYTTTNTMNVTGGTIPAYLTISGSGNSQTVRVASSVNNGTAADSKTVRGATYIQNGLYQAWQQFDAVTDVKVPAGQPQAGAQRTPVVVLMSDGAPTAATVNYNNVQTSHLGNGTANSTTNFMGFVTQLTAAYVRGEMKAKYGAEPKFYTLGVGTGNSSVATSVLNPASSNTTINGYWRTFDSVAAGQNAWINNRSVYKDAAVAGKNYVDQYWLTDSAEGLINAFKEIVNTMVLESENYSTLVDMTQGADLSGYVTFEDELGELMEVKSVKGMVMGNHIFTGAELAKGMTSGVLGTVDGPTAAGDELVRTVKERMGIAETSVAQTLIDNAFNAKQLNYVSATEYSNYIGWYADENGKYVGFWQESDGYTAENAPANAKYINKSYGYLGEPLTEDGTGSDMMHIVVMVHTEIATGRQSVVYKIPAALLPSVTYNVELNGENIESPKNLTREGADPMRLLFEVGLRSDINPVNMEQKIADHVANGGHVHENNDGTYTFYTNLWGDGDGGDINYDETLSHLTTVSHFNPALENERYYHVADDLVYSNENGTVYNGAAAPSGSGYYFARPYYEVVGGNVRYTVKYAPINATVLTQAQKGDNGWYIPEGTAHSLERFADAKTDNTTDTLNYSWNPVLLHDSEGYHSYTFLGNNGTFTVAPAQGIALTKTVAEEVANAPTTFRFSITLSQAVANPTVTDLDGNPLENVHSVSGNVITVNIKKDQTIVITGIPTGVTYTVEEEANPYYTPTISSATGTVIANTITKVEAENVPKIYNDLIVSKDVTHPFVNVPGALTAQAFTIVVDLDGEDVANESYAVTGLTGITAVATDADGKFSVQLRDGESFTVKDLPAGTTYTVTETNLPAGYKLVTAAAALTGTITDGNPAQTHVINNYAPATADTTLTITGEKTVTSSGNMSYDWTGKSFQFKLESYDPATQSYTQVGELKKVVENGGKYTFTLPGVTFDTLGTYYYKVSEVIPEQNDREEHMAYDATTGRIVVHVTDNDVDGKLELEVRNYDTDEVLAVNNNVITFTKNFNNSYTEDYDPTFVEFTVDKNIVDTHNTGVSPAGFLFGLYKEGESTPAYTMRSVGADGKATFHIPITAPIAGDTYILKEIIPADADKIPGMVYDTTEYQVVISATANGSKLTPSVVITKNGQPFVEPVFKNTMDLEPASTQFAVEKKVEGNPPAEEYTFTLTETDGSFATAKQGGVTDTVKINGAGHGRFLNITYTAVGTHYYVVKETPGTNPGITYDASEYHITVNVTNVNGELQAATTVVKLGVGTVQNIEFTNTYKITQTASVTIHGTKRLDGREILADEFTFGLYENGALVESVKNATNGRFTFAPITYTAPGIHIYTVKEILPDDLVNGKKDGITYSTEEYTVKVEVTDNGTGGLKVVETISLPNASVASYDKLIITNTYAAKPAEKDITAQKTWFDTDAGEGKTVTADKFSVTLYKADENYNRGDVVKTQKIGANATATIAVQYSKIGTYYYVLHEDMIKDAADEDYDPTVAYDASRYLIRDVVTDDGKGQLHVIRTVVKDGVGEVNEIAFGNLYTPVAAEYAITGTKELKNRPLALQDGEFTFQLFEGNTLLEEVQNVGGTFTFTAIPYEKSGTYTYKVVEKLPDGHVNGKLNGITYDRTEYTYTVKVEDVNGQLTVTETSHTAAQLKFTNTYEGTGTQISVSGTKTFNKAMTGGEFTFELYKGNNLIQIQTNGASVPGADNTHNAGFTFVIPLESAGEHVFTLKEKNGGQNIAGVAYSPDVYTIAVNVTDNNNGQLEAGIPAITKGSAAAAEIKFENSYSVAPITDASLQITKKIIGDRTQLLPGETYTFRLYKGNDYVMEANNDQSGAVKFNGIRIETVGTHVFTIKEVIPSDAVNNVKDGVTYSTAEITATVNVVDNGDGTLSVESVNYTNQAQITNTYTLSGPVYFGLAGTKVMEGRSLNANDVFTFILKDASGTEIARTQNSGDIFRFEGVGLSTLGDHYFTVVEQAPAGGVKDGVTYSTEVYDVYVRVTDNGTGKMVASAPVVTVRGAAKALAFTNTYAVTQGTTTEIVGKKTLNGKALAANQFTFALYAGTDTTAQPIATVKNGANGTIKFENVPLNTLGMNIFTVIEQAPAGGKLDGITYSNLAYTVKVETTDNGVGGMTAGQPQYYLGAAQQNSMEFINVYAVEGQASATIQGFKTLEGGKKLEANMFTFELYEGNQLLERVQNAADGAIKFNLSYEVDDIGQHTYTVKEVAPEGYEAEGIRYTYLYYNVDVVVEDNGVGGLTVKDPVYRLGADVVEEMEFVNVYTPEDQNIALTIEKVVEILSGEKEVGPEGFKFKVEDEEGKTVATLTTNEDGKAAHTLTFTAKDIGKTFTYKITEIDTKKPGITYSDAVYEVCITIGQAETGELTTSMTVNGQAVFAVRAFFRNTYEAPEIPQTGDTVNLGLYVSMMALSALGFVAMLILRKKEEHAN